MVDGLRRLEYNEFLMKVLLLMLALIGGAFAKELTLESAISIALENNLEIRAFKSDIKAKELELKSVKGSYFPKIKLEEIFTRTDIPVYAFMSKLNQERFGIEDFQPSKLNNPPAINNFETKLSIEVPLWLGGKIQAMEKTAFHNLSAVKEDYERKKDEVVLKVYHAYMDAVLAKNSVEVSHQVLKDAQEHVRLAESMYKVGTALLSDVLRARVYLSKAEENLKASENNYRVSKKAIELITNTELGDFDVVSVETCPAVSVEKLKDMALERRQDIKALQERIKVLEGMYGVVLSDNLPQVYAFGSYSLYSKSAPFGSDGSGYMVGAGISWSFDTGLSTLRRAQSYLETKRALEERLKLLKASVFFEIDKAYADYQNALYSLRSAEERIKQSQEVVRTMELRYKTGLARIVDLLDAQTELDRARFEKLQALNNCQKAYANLLYSAGLIREVER
ncbi:Outer membrane protein TolC [Hydrogenobacter hydrogenophilus]|uniref:Outer membrane protein TolC n=2 Tax=Hydrogenobacter hydrogenophilus TaxID=35835 RepID=A0A285NRI7_9AQUI|nr:Outer membrane protein TolC [Hydrogenobacter hydrogenophilus]